MASTLAIAAVFVCWTIIALPCALPTVVLHGLWPSVMRRANRRLIWLYGRIALFFLRPWMPVRMGRPDLAVRLPRSIILPNHQSFLDLYLLSAQNQPNVCMVTKGWPFRLLFFFAPSMRGAGYVNAEALSPKAVEELCLQRLQEGATLVIFPEGRRSRDGSLGRFHSGAFRVAVKAQVPVLPLLIRNTFRIFPPGGKSFSPAPIEMEFLDPVHPQDFAAELLPHRAMLRRARALFLPHLQSLTTDEES
ncbi:MAG: 1-acyl-sn-glycerol-3-phosphate acyltransferase [Deltaproteobacteria bacterium]|jgi:1-acyl-sn-glycerol-3-phosphate acyltransferase|nr:1-acyl-sn-glycerol-3-phosphate acyltransferase [Deltaproteobacteria bacterium]